MIRIVVGNSFDEYLKKGVSAARAIELLRQHDCLSFPQLASGLFPAVNFGEFEQNETGMSDAWLRDTSCIGLVLLKTDQRDAAAKAVKGVISRLMAIRQSFETIITLSHPPDNDAQRPPVRFSGQDSVPRYDWANAQNDALGYSLQFVGDAIRANVLQAAQKEQELVERVVDYLEVVKYWQDADSGHWEEVKR